jgi:hypothetical protein
LILTRKPTSSLNVGADISPEQTAAAATDKGASETANNQLAQPGAVEVSFVGTEQSTNETVELALVCSDVEHFGRG